MRLTLALTSAPALAVINPVPAVPRNVVVFPERDSVEAEGFPAGAALEVRTLRDGVLLATASATAGPDGGVEINHPGGAC